MRRAAWWERGRVGANACVFGPCFHSHNGARTFADAGTELRRDFPLGADQHSKHPRRRSASTPPPVLQCGHLDVHRGRGVLESSLLLLSALF